VRSGAAGLRARSQSSIALSADGRRWFLVNASPDVRIQIEACSPLLPCESSRGTGVDSVLLTNADLDHTLGLFVLREGERLCVHATPPVKKALTYSVRLASVLACYCGLEWREPPTELHPLHYADGSPSGLHYAAFAVPGKPPRYREETPNTSDCVGYRFEDEASGGRLVVIPDVASPDETVMAQLRECDALLLDGTFWSNDEMQQAGVGTATAAQMGHWPVGGPGGSLAQLARLRLPRAIYVHINNTNPMLRDESPQRQAVTAAGAEVGWDGLELDI
jgi:pyrroloquinoline quinone biosynthesis protein B